MTDLSQPSSNPLVDELIANAAKALDAGDSIQAQRLTARAIALAPHSEAAWWQMALSVDNLQQLRDCLKRVLEINPNHAEALKALDLAENSGKMSLSKQAGESTDSGSLSPFHEVTSQTSTSPFTDETVEEDLRANWSAESFEAAAKETDSAMPAFDPSRFEAALPTQPEPTGETFILPWAKDSVPPAFPEENAIPAPSPYVETVPAAREPSPIETPSWLNPNATVEETIKPERLSAEKRRVSSLGIWLGGTFFAVSLAVMGYGAYQTLMRYLSTGTLSGGTNLLLQTYGLWVGMFLLGLIFSIVFYNGMMNGIDRIEEAHALERTGKTIRGHIINRWVEENEKGKGYFVAYQFELNTRTGGANTYRLKQMVNEKLYSKLEMGVEVQVRYMPGDPYIARME